MFVFSRLISLYIVSLGLIIMADLIDNPSNIIMEIFSKTDDDVSFINCDDFTQENAVSCIAYV